MSKVHIQCPECGHQTSVDAAKDPNWEKLKLAPCSRCGFQDIGKKWIDCSTTVIPQVEPKTVLGHLRSVNSNAIIQLTEGTTLLGRVLLNPEDKSISKDHAKIEVVKIHDGSLQHRFSDTNSKNPTVLNGGKIEKGQIFALHPEDKLLFGKESEFVFEISGWQNDGTEII